MVDRTPYVPSRDLLTEDLRVGVPLDLKRALTDAARREGKSVAGKVREVVADALERGSHSAQEPATDRRGTR